MYKLLFTKEAHKDLKKIKSTNLLNPLQNLLSLLKKDPLKTPPPFKYLVGDLKGLISRRINIKHRLVYQILEESQTVLIMRMFSHYGE